MDVGEEPQTLTVEEAAKVLRIGRTAAYALAREWRATNGASGLPVLELGRTLRVPRHALQIMLEKTRTPVVQQKSSLAAPANQRSARRAADACQTSWWTSELDG
jgi:hypothetical protein